MQNIFATLMGLLAQGEARQASTALQAVLSTLPQEECESLTVQLKQGLRAGMGNIDPIVQEEFCGYLFLSMGDRERGSASLERALQLKNTRLRAQDEGIDFSDAAGLYQVVGTLDFVEYARGRSRADRAAPLLCPDTVGYLVMSQQMEILLPLCEAFPQAHWLTVGDGRHAFEARYLMKQGCTVLPSNLDTTLLEEAKEMGLITEYAKENLEKLSFADNSFDFVCCKETAHHLQRPYIGLYEMLRVARHGVFLLEPFDKGFGDSVLRGTRAANAWHSFEEEAGNYVFAYSERELEKICVAEGLACLAIRGIAVVEGGCIDNLSTDPRDLRRQRARVEREEILCRKSGQWKSYAALLLKDLPNQSLRGALEGAGFILIDIPHNPHMERAALDYLTKYYARQQ